MKRWNNDVPASCQTLASVMNGEKSAAYSPEAGRSADQVREIDCVLADIQAEIQMLRQEKTYLRLVRGELTGRKPSRGVRHPVPLR